MPNEKELTKEELLKLLKQREEEIRYLGENINNKDEEISNLKEAHEKELNTKIEEALKAKETDIKNNNDSFEKIINNQTSYITRRETELSELVNLSNNITTCIDSFAAICKYANSEIIKKVTKEN